MQNLYSEFISVIKMLSVGRFSKILQALLPQIEIKMLTRKYYPALQQSNIISENSVSDVRFYTLHCFFLYLSHSKLSKLFNASALEVSDVRDLPISATGANYRSNNNHLADSLVTLTQKVTWLCAHTLYEWKRFPADVAPFYMVL